MGSLGQLSAASRASLPKSVVGLLHTDREADDKKRVAFKYFFRVSRKILSSPFHRIIMKVMPVQLNRLSAEYYQQLGETVVRAIATREVVLESDLTMKRERLSGVTQSSRRFVRLSFRVMSARFRRSVGGFVVMDKWRFCTPDSYSFSLACRNE